MGAGSGKVSTPPTMKQHIKLEPHKDFKKAIVRTSKDGCITYNYYLLITVCMKMHKWDWDTATEWVEYNIVSLAPNGFKVSYAQAK
jgi:hypothetical protein